jgi:response regulator NasT
MGMNVMLVETIQEKTFSLDATLMKADYEIIARLNAGADLYKMVDKYHPDLIVIDMESPDQEILRHMYNINNELPTPIVVFAEKGDREIIDAAIKAGVSAFVVDGLEVERVLPVIDVAIARFREYQAMRNDLKETRTQLSNRKTIDRAKGILMKLRGFSEDEAYKAMRKQAMDRNKRVVEVAQGIIETADLLG